MCKIRFAACNISHVSPGGTDLHDDQTCFSKPPTRRISAIASTSAMGVRGVTFLLKMRRRAYSESDKLAFSASAISVTYSVTESAIVKFLRATMNYLFKRQVRGGRGVCLFRSRPKGRDRATTMVTANERDCFFCLSVELSSARPCLSIVEAQPRRCAFVSETASVEREDVLECRKQMSGAQMLTHVNTYPATLFTNIASLNRFVKRHVCSHYRHSFDHIGHYFNHHSHYCNHHANSKRIAT